MLHLLASLVVLLGTTATSATLQNPELPSTWTKDFTITLSYSGSMDGSSTHIRFTHDFCHIVRQNGMNAPEERKFRLTEADRTEILKKLHALKVDNLKSERNPDPVNDGWLTSMCFGLHCVEAGPSVTISDTDKETFHQAYDYLENFGAPKSTSKKKK